MISVSFIEIINSLSCLITNSIRFQNYAFSFPTHYDDLCHMYYLQAQIIYIPTGMMCVLPYKHFTMNQTSNQYVNTNPWQRGYSCCHPLTRGTWDFGKQSLFRYSPVLYVLNSITHSITSPVILQKKNCFSP
jgi:hypothetical protein